jgi:ribosomal protein S18 acetylase RimI-like enzyme
MGLLSDIVGMIDRAKQSAKANVGLLVSDPREYMASLNDQARAFNQAGDLATQAKLNEMRGLLVTPEQAAAKEYVDRVNQDIAMGFAGTTSVGKPNFSVIKSNASDIFGVGAERLKYIDPKSGGFIDILSKPDGTASILGLEVPTKFRGMKIGESLQAKAMEDFPILQGQVSSKAAAKTAYRLGRRPVGSPNATLEDVFNAIDKDSSVNLVSPEMQMRFR